MDEICLWRSSATSVEAAGEQTVTVTKGWAEAYSMFPGVEADLVLSYTTSPAYHLIAENDARFATANFREGHYLQVEVAAKVKSTKMASWRTSSGNLS